MNFAITRRIKIDAGHRIISHGSKCRSPHGHEFHIEATVEGGLIRSGEQSGMVLDFGFLKEEMMDIIDANCDHGFIYSVDDCILDTLFDPVNLKDIKEEIGVNPAAGVLGYYSLTDGTRCKTYTIADAPTSENLARHWFLRLQPRVQVRSNGNGRLTKIRVHETENCFSDYPVK